MTVRSFISAAALGFVASVSGAQAQDATFLQDGTRFSASYNEHGMILTPTDGQPGVVYLGIGCDVFSPSRGTGRWSARGSRIYVEFTTGETLPFNGSARPEFRALCPL